MICIVCEQNVEDRDIAYNIRPGDWVICAGCDPITPNRQQAGQHWLKRAPEWERLKKIEEAMLVHVIPPPITDMIIALTDMRRQAEKQGIVTHEYHAKTLIPNEAAIERRLPGWCVVWQPEISAYGVFPDSRCP